MATKKTMFFETSIFELSRSHIFPRSLNLDGNFGLFAGTYRSNYSINEAIVSIVRVWARPVIKIIQSR